MAYAEALTTWGDLGGYELEAQWASAVQRVVKSSVDDVGTRRVGELSGGERKRLVLDLVLNSGADVLLLDEPDNYLDIPTRWWLEEQLRQTKSTVLMVSHDRAVLDAVATKVIAIEGSGAWVHGGSFATFPQARADRQERLGDALQRWKDEERRLFRHMKIMKQRAAVNYKNASKANAAETRWEKFVAAGPPPPPVPDQQINVGLRGADSARRVVQMIDVTVDDLFFPFSDEVYFGERVGLIGPNGTGKTHLMNALAGVGAFDGTINFGPRTSVGMFTQVNDRPEFRGRTCLEVLEPLAHTFELSMTALARYGLADAGRQEHQTLSGGQKARLEILTLELAGHNVLLLDEPTDNLDVDSAVALEQALERFVGTVIAVSHDRTFLRQLDRFLMISDDGDVIGLPDFDLAVTALAEPDDRRLAPPGERAHVEVGARCLTPRTNFYAPGHGDADAMGDRDQDRGTASGTSSGSAPWRPRVSTSPARGGWSTRWCAATPVSSTPVAAPGGPAPTSIRSVTTWSVSTPTRS